jgi:hypothetical protein
MRVQGESGQAVEAHNGFVINTLEEGEALCLPAPVSHLGGVESC